MVTPSVRALSLASVVSLALWGCSKQAPEASSAARAPQRELGAAKLSDAEGSTAKAELFVSPARVVPRSLWEHAEPRIVVSGLRAERSPAGDVIVARDLIPGNDEPGALALPERLGGGYLFFSAGATTQLFRAETWTAPLTPLATVDMHADRIAPGFDRLYLLGRRETWALDAKSGRVVPLGPLPKAAAYRELAFADGFSALAEVPLAGVLATFDAGQNWWPVQGASSVVSSPGELLVATADDRVLRLRDDGSLQPDEAPVVEDAFEIPEQALEGRRVLEGAILRGAFVGHGPDLAPRALVVVAGDLLLVDLQRGAVLSRTPRVVAPDASCQALDLGGEVGFACSSGEGGARVGSRRSLELARATQGMTWQRLAHFAGARAILGAGPAGALVSGPCAPEVGDERPVDAARRICVVSSKRVWELGAPQGGVVVSTKQGVAVLVPPSKRAGSLILPDGARKELALPAEREMRTLLSAGQWLPGGFQAEDGRLAFWVTLGDSFAGVRVDERGRVEVGTIQRPLRRALLSGRFALSWGAAGFAKESVDGGLTFHDASFPYRTGDADPTQPRNGAQVELGCSAVGCLLGPWMRIGWGSPGAMRLTDAKAPPLRASVEESAGQWRLSCRPTGRFSEPARPEDGSKDPWPAFAELAPPERGARAVSYTLSTLSDDARVYAWGPEDGSWGERGSLQVSFHHPFEFDRPLRTLTGRTPWSDGQRAALAFADGSGAGIAVAAAALDPGGRGGLLLLRSPAEAHLFVVETDRAPQVVQGVSEAGLSALDDGVQSGDAWYTTQPFGAAVRVYRIRAGRIDVVAELPTGAGGVPRSRIVRSASGGQLAVWAEGEAGAVLYPLDVARGALEAPLVVPPLATRPHACSVDANGYVVSQELSVAPQVEVLGMSAGVDISRVTVELLVGAREPCVTRFSATTRDLVGKVVAQPPVDPDSAPLTLVEKREGGRRWELICGGR